ncbi:regulator of microtubule dynamics protein 1 isoform X2 [Microtus oregoni]|uniref:regulator of microtubule dynamics protein 1 isoform X2 n=1 Tax=Microtus oregoni TaxID=111838 RepID=UPI001BB19C03|nr:regulator of microtubule dynamics protein 1 isoform X2 [Microtus oregoni]
MALSSRLWRLLPLRRGATQSFRQLARTWGSRGHCGSEVIRNTRPFKRGLLFSALSFLGFETYQVISQAAVVHATAKVEEILEQADYLYESGETEKLYQLLTQYKESEDAELLWRLARASRDIAQLSRTSEEEKKVLVYEALEYAKRALEKNESSFAAHKWYAICISDVGDYEGIKVKIANAYIIKEHFQKAIELNPKDATSIHLMGIWCYTFAEMPWYQRRIAKVLFANPPTSTYEEALKYFHRAEQDTDRSCSVAYRFVTRAENFLEKATIYLTLCISLIYKDDTLTIMILWLPPPQFFYV